MKKEEVLNAVKAVKEASKKRNFKQTFDLIVNLKAFDPKKQPIENYITLPKGRGKKLKIAAIVDKELSVEAKKIFDLVIMKDDFPEWQGSNKKLRKLAREYDFFVGQANIMPVIASVFGKALGPKGKMPNPKNGGIIPANPAVLKNVYEKMQATTKMAAKSEAVVKCAVGSEESRDEELVENIMLVYNTLISQLPQEEGNIKSVLVKLTMGKPYKLAGGK